jgi:hypothetical protein
LKLQITRNSHVLTKARVWALGAAMAPLKEGHMIQRKSEPIMEKRSLE